MPRTTAILLGSILLLSCLPRAFGDPNDNAFKEELKAMAGTWRPTFAENNGNPTSEERMKDTRWTRDAAGNWAFTRDGETVLLWAVKAIDATTTPKTIDIEVASGEHKGVIYLGIYELDGDTLRICFAMPDNPERPTRFFAGKASGCALTEFKREKD